MHSDIDFVRRSSYVLKEGLLLGLVNLDKYLVDKKDQKQDENDWLELGLHVAAIFIATEHHAELVPHT